MLAYPVSDTSTLQRDLEQTPLMRQFWAAKRQHPDALLFFRMGDFYELFFDDAKVASRELQIQLTARDKERSVPMCGVPYHAAENYVARLLRKARTPSMPSSTSARAMNRSPAVTVHASPETRCSVKLCASMPRTSTWASAQPSTRKA